MSNEPSVTEILGKTCLYRCEKPLFSTLCLLPLCPIRWLGFSLLKSWVPFPIVKVPTRHDFWLAFKTVFRVFGGHAHRPCGVWYLRGSARWLSRSHVHNPMLSQVIKQKASTSEGNPPIGALIGVPYLDAIPCITLGFNISKKDSRLEVSTYKLK